ncbi:hypothetical protein [Streptomyces sp. CBMA123]|uniref:hypothetical protein n=1 Tax=Streptomyces sp. CBMA123 TaxID=1896313 RepID=UPI0016619853|nr:hypothetical protein [Streptomyces sp. CBMA123]MBD0694581.1 hypothetical protein [Streptomyces sp. CBMA123]
MAKRPNKKQKRPLAAGVSRPAGTARRRPRKDVPLSPRTVRRTALLAGLVAPLLILGLLAVATNPDYQAPCTIIAVLVLMAAVIGVMMIRTSGWVLWPAVLLGVLLLALPTAALRAQLISHRGVDTRVVITSAHSGKDKTGKVSWTCGIRREDGRPLPHGTIGGFGCSGSSVGGTTTALADPDGWAPPATLDDDLSFRAAGVWVAGAVAVLWAGLTFGAARRTLRGRGGRGGKGGRSKGAAA